MAEYIIGEKYNDTFAKYFEGIHNGNNVRYDI